MSVEIRICRDQAEFGRALYGIGQYFAAPATDEQLARFTQVLEIGRMHAAVEGDEIVGGAGAFSFDLSVPGGSLPCAGVTVVGVYPTHRRRGVLRAMMRAQLDDVHERGEPIAALWASEETIYGRFGYGLAAWCGEIKVPREWGAFARPLERRGEFRLVTPDGPKVITVHAARIAEMFGHPETVLIAFDDITTLKDVHTQLEEAVRVRQDFLSIAGHELKTPLTSVLLNLRSVDKALQGGAATGDARFVARWRALGQQIGRLERLVDQLLDVSRITAGKLALVPEPLDFAELVREVVGRFSPPSTAEGGAIHVQVDGPVEGQWDRLRVEQILTNLLSNAVKYGGGRPISVDVRTGGAGDDAEVLLTVSDQGIGMSSDDLGRIFGRFERAVSGRNYGGLGLGLWIVRQVVDAMGGSVSVESQPGRGSTFTVRLPRHAAPTARV